LLHLVLLHKGNVTLPDRQMEQTSQNSLDTDLNPKLVSKQGAQPQPSELVPPPVVTQCR